MLIKYIFIVLVLLCSTALLAECIPESDASIDGVYPGLPFESIGEAPIADREVLWGEDDGGRYEISRYTYDSYQLDVVRNTVDVVRLSSKNIFWYKGVHLGQIKFDVKSQLAVTAIVDGVDSDLYLVCSEYGDVYAALIYTSGRLSSVELAMDRP